MTEEQRVHRNEYNRAYYIKNRERLKEHQREYEKTRRVRTPEQIELAKTYRKAWGEKHKDRRNGYYRKSNLKRNYGLTLKQFDELVAACGNKCAVCGQTFRKELKEPHIDHCHKTGVVRGLLCQKHNLVEGLLGTPEVALKMYEYMKRAELFYQGEN